MTFFTSPDLFSQTLQADIDNKTVIQSKTQISLFISLFSLTIKTKAGCFSSVFLTSKRLVKLTRNRSKYVAHIGRLSIIPSLPSVASRTSMVTRTAQNATVSAINFLFPVFAICKRNITIGAAQQNANTSAPVQCDIHLSDVRISSSPADGTLIVTNIAAQPTEPLIIPPLLL